MLRVEPPKPEPRGPVKVTLATYVQSSTAEGLKAKAEKHGVSLTDLTDLLLRYGLSRFPDDALSQWVKTLKSNKGRNAGGLRLHERLVFAAFDRLKGKGAAYRFSGQELAAEAGLKLSEAYWALKGLQAREMVRGSEFDAVDRWGRPVKSFWVLTADAAPAA